MAFTEAVHNAEWNGRSLAIRPNWLRDVVGRNCKSLQCDVAFTVWLVGHELGHYAHGHLYEGADRQRHYAEEQLADFIGGQALAICDADLGSVLNALEDLCPNPTDTHPGFWVRQQAVNRGYNAAIRAGFGRAG